MAGPDFAAILAEESRRGGQRLRVDVVLAELDPETRASVEKALRDQSVNAAVLARAISRLGHTVSEAAVRTWRLRKL